MKRFCLLLVCLLCLSLTACGGAREENLPPETEAAETAAPTAPAETTAPTPGAFGLAYVEEYGDQKGLNPYNCTCTTNRPIISLLYEGLFSLNSHYEAEPVLCDKLAVADNGRTYVFTIKEEARFSDGSELTAWDVQASLNAASDSPYYGRRFAQVAEFSVRDRKTLTVSLYRPYENLPLLLDVPIVKADTVADDIPLGSGPYRMGDRALERDPSWWQKGQPPLSFDRIPLTLAKSPTEVRDSFEFGGTSLVCVDLNAPSAVGYRCDYELWDCPTTTMVYLGFNLGAGVCADPVFRAGITHIVSREEIIKTIYKGFGSAAFLPCAPDSPFYDEALAANYAYDETAFRTALRSSGVRTGFSGTILVCSADTTRVELAHTLAETLNGYGLKFTVNAVDYSNYLLQLGLGSYDIYVGEVRLPANFDLNEFFRPYGSLSYGGLTNYTLEGLCNDALENSGNYYDLHKQVMDNASICPLLFKSYAIMANRGAIAHLYAGVDSVFHTAGGRTLADATVPYSALIPDPDAPEETGETESDAAETASP